MAAVADNGGRIGQIAAVAPSRAASLLSCALAEAFRAGSTAPRLPTHPKAHFGTLAHSFLRNAMSGAFAGYSETELRGEWRQTVQGYEASLLADPAEGAVVPLARSCDDFEVNGLRLVKTALRISQNRSPSTRPKSGDSATEARIASGDGLIVGRLDRVTWEAGALVVADIKTGAIDTTPGGVRPEYKLQLMLYAFLIHEKFGEWPRSLRIIPLTGDPIDLPFDSNEVIAIASAVKLTLARANELIARVRQRQSDEKSLAAPSPDACRFCRFRLTCDAYWQARQTSSESSWPWDVTGEIASARALGSKISLVELRNAGAGPLVIRGINNLASQNSRVGLAVRVCDLKAERAVGVFSWRPTSVIFPAF
jgi:hypothetical protein